MIGYADADWSSDHNNHHSQTGWFVKLANCVFSWQSHQQKCTALSSMEAEYMSLSDCSRQLVWLQQLIDELGYQLHSITLCGDNQGAIFMASNPVIEGQNEHVIEGRNKHVKLKWHSIRDFIHEGLVELFYIEGSKNPANMLTKNLGHVKLDQFRSQLGLVFYDHPQES